MAPSAVLQHEAEDDRHLKTYTGSSSTITASVLHGPRDLRLVSALSFLPRLPSTYPTQTVLTCLFWVKVPYPPWIYAVTAEPHKSLTTPLLFLFFQGKKKKKKID